MTVTRQGLALTGMCFPSLKYSWNVSVYNSASAVRSPHCAPLTKLIAGMWPPGSWLAAL